MDGDEDDTEQEWKYVDAPNSAFPNAQSDLAGVEPYLEFTIDQYGELHAVRNESWTNLPKHYLTKDVKVHKNYLYKIEEVLVRDLQSEEVAVNAMYIQPDSTDLTNKYYLSKDGSQWKVTKPVEGVGPVPAENIVNVTVTYDSSNYAKVHYKNNDYYAKADKDGKTNYVTYEKIGDDTEQKYYIVTGTETNASTEKEYTVAYDKAFVNGNNSESVTIGGNKYYSVIDSQTHAKTITVGGTLCNVEELNYITVNNTKLEVTYNSGTKKYYVNSTEVTIANGKVSYNAEPYSLEYCEYIEYGGQKYYLESVEEIQTKNTVNKTKASVSKTWTDDSDKYSTRPDSILYELQYGTKDGSEEWKNVESGWIFDVYEGSIADGNKKVYTYQSVSDDNMYFRFDGDKYYVLTDVTRKYVVINNEKIYIETSGANQYLKLDNKTVAYDGSSPTIHITDKYKVQTAPDGSGDYILINGDRVYVSSDTVKLNDDAQNGTFSVVNGEVDITLNVKSETTTLNVFKKSDNKYYYTVNGVDTEVTSEELYIQTASAKPDNVILNKNGIYKVTVTKDGNDLKINTYKNTNDYSNADNIKSTVEAVDTETLYIKVNLTGSDGAKNVPKIIVDKLPSTDSKNRPLQYRFVESYLHYSNGNVYVAMPSENSMYTKAETTNSAFDTTVSNTLKTTSLTVKKTWGEDLYHIADNIQSVSFEIQRRVKTSDLNGGTYMDWETVNYKSGNSTVNGGDISMTWNSQAPVQGQSATYNGETGWTGLPKYDIQNREYEYRAVEVKITDQNNLSTSATNTQDSGSSGSVGGFSYTSYHSKTWTDGNVTKYSSVLTNVPVVSKLAVTKEWDDNNDRDGKRTDITLTLTPVTADNSVLTIPDGKGTVTVKNYYTNGSSADASKTNAKLAETGSAGSYEYYPDNYYYVWYNLPVRDVNGNPILYTVTENDIPTNYTTQVRVFDYSGNDENKSTYADKYSYTVDGVEYAVDDTTSMYIEIPTRTIVTLDGDELKATVGGEAKTAKVKGAVMAIQDGNTTYTVRAEMNREYVQIGTNKLYVQTDNNGSYILLDGERFTKSENTVTGSKEYEVKTDGTGSYITVNGTRVAVNGTSVTVNDQNYTVSDGKTAITSMNLQSETVSAPVSRFAFEDGEIDVNRKLTAETYLREAEVTPEYSPSVFSGTNLKNAMTYENTESALTTNSNEYSQLTDVTRIDFKNIYQPRTVQVKADKTWVGDSEHGSEAWKKSRPPQGIKYVIEYRRTTEENEEQWQEVPFDTWKNIYEGLNGTGKESQEIVGVTTTDNSDPSNPVINYPSETDWDYIWDHLPSYEYGKVGVKFEYRVREVAVNYGDGTDGLYNYAQSYVNDVAHNGQSTPKVLEGDDSKTNTEVTEAIFNTLRTAFIKKIIDPDYIGNVKPQLYNKEFHFKVIITQRNSDNPIPDMRMQKMSEGVATDIRIGDDGKTAYIDLKHGDEVSVFNIPAAGMQYYVEEDDYALEGFNAYVVVDMNYSQEKKTRIVSGEFLGTEQHSILYINRPLPLPATGGSGIQIFFEIAFGFITAGAILGFVYWLSRRKALYEQMN